MSNRILAIDVGSTTTKALLFSTENGLLRLQARTEAATTVEKPKENVMLGVIEAISKVEKEKDVTIIAQDKIIIPQELERGVDAFVVTSSAGGGLQMIVGGIWRNMTAHSANKAALGAGAIVMDALSIDDSLNAAEKIRLLKERRPDMILMAGGTDGGNVSGVAGLAEIIGQAQLKPRLGNQYKLPVVFAGNEDARDIVASFLGENADLYYSENIRPVLDEEYTDTVRDIIHELFLTHVMSQAPGYTPLLEWSNKAMLPTPSAVGRIIDEYAKQGDKNIVAVDMGGATTDVFSSIEIMRRPHRKAGVLNSFASPAPTVAERFFHRSVSANIGMSYSIGNVMAQVGVEKISRWIPFEISEEDLQDWVYNKMLRPTTMPTDMKSLILEHAFAREGLRLAFSHHQDMAGKLRGVPIVRGMADGPNPVNVNEGTVVEPINVDIMIASGGVLSHAPHPMQAMQILIDGLEPVGITELLVDEHFMLPQIGMISTIEPSMAFEALENDCLHPLGTVVAPMGKRISTGRAIAKITIEAEGVHQSHDVVGGKLSLVKLPTTGKYTLTVAPSRRYDVGAGFGREVKREVVAGSCGLVLDGRGRPAVALEPKQLKEWYDKTELYASV